MSLSSSAFSARADAASSAGLAYDGRSLDVLRHASPQDREAIRQVAQQFEALFMRQLLKGMRDAVPKSGMFDGAGSDTFTSMLDTQLSTVAAGQGNGLAAMIERQLLGGAGEGARPASVVGAWSPREGEPFMPKPSAAEVTLSSYSEGLGQGEQSDPSRRGGDARSGWLDAAASSPSGGRVVVGQGLAALGPVQAAFVQKMWPHALKAQKQTGLPAAWVVGQAALESGWGQRDIRDAQGNPSHNLFGIKAGKGWTGRTVAAMTTEYVDGVARKSVELFRRYESYAEAFADWATLMAANPRYRQVVQAGSAREFAEGLEKGGYATDPAYGTKLKQTIGSLLRAVTGQRQ